MSKSLLEGGRLAAGADAIGVVPRSGRTRRRTIGVAPGCEPRTSRLGRGGALLAAGAVSCGASSGAGVAFGPPASIAGNGCAIVARGGSLVDRPDHERMTATRASKAAAPTASATKPRSCRFRRTRGTKTVFCSCDASMALAAWEGLRATSTGGAGSLFASSWGLAGAFTPPFGGTVSCNSSGEADGSFADIHLRR